MPKIPRKEFESRKARNEFVFFSGIFFEEHARNPPSVPFGVNVYENSTGDDYRDFLMKHQGWKNAIYLPATPAVDGTQNMIWFDMLDETSRVNEFATCLLSADDKRLKETSTVCPIRGACVFLPWVDSEPYKQPKLHKLPFCISLAHAAAAFQDAKSVLESQ